MPDKPPGSCGFLHSSLTLREGTGLSLEELAMPDLDLIKQGEQGCGTGADVADGPDLRPPYDGSAAPAPGLERDLLFSSPRN